MQQNLVIVESPAKAKTIGRFLGKDYKVLPSYGHIRDLKSKYFSIDTTTFEPLYEIPEDKKQIVSHLKSEAKKSSTIWLASDEDREGEAISWHLAQVLGLDIKSTKRIVFHEITKTAIEEAIKHPRHIDENLVNAQQARRVLDRIVGFKLSPLLWRKIKPALSAGRVQSVAVRLICDREKEIENFKAIPFYVVTAVFSVTQPDNTVEEFKAELNKTFSSKDEAVAFLKHCANAQMSISDITKKPVKHMPSPPFKTSTLQQEAAHKLGYSVSQTMRIAQSLYEAGHITYMRTDSLNLSSLCLNSSHKYIVDTYGETYAKLRKYQTNAKGAQEAHEAIRPTFMDIEDITGTPAEKRLYKLIRLRTLASQMADATFEKTTVTINIDGREETFTATGEVQKFDGFLKIYKASDNGESENVMTLLPELKKGYAITYNTINTTQRFTQQHARYNEASLVRKMEELGIGRPSTYAPIISTIQQRGYVEKVNREGTSRTYTIFTLQQKTKEILETVKKETFGSERGKLLPTDIGTVVNNFLLAEFPNILDYNFTANIEKDFDSIAEGKKDWNAMMKTFYNNFIPEVEKAMDLKSEKKVGERTLGIDPDTGREVSVKIGRFGTMVQLGTTEDKIKPVFTPLLKSQSLETITLDDALNLLRMPRTLGEFEGETVVVNNGRFGPYVLHNKKYYPIPKDSDVLTISLDEAVDIIQQKRTADASRHIKTFEENPEISILNGRFGPYISYKKKNYHLPKKLAADPTALTLQECMDVINKQENTEDSKKAQHSKKKK